MPGIAKITRSALACALALAAGAGPSPAADQCDPCERPEYCLPACAPDADADMTEFCADHCGEPALAKADPAAPHANDVSVSSRNVTTRSRSDTSVSFPTPSMNGSIQTASFPLPYPAAPRDDEQTGQFAPAGLLASRQ